jgi:hypothetical protein
MVEEVERDVRVGEYHQGRSATVRVIARKRKLCLRGNQEQATRWNK